MDKFKYWIIILLFASQSLHALTTCNVTISSDNNPGGAGEAGDLRFCLNSMNQGLNTTPDDYAIVFASPMTIQLNGILPIINNSSNPVNITIGNSSSTATVTIDGNSGAYSGFFIPMGNVTIQNMIFQNLTAKGGNGGNGIASGGGGLGAGGAIYAPQSFLNGSNPSVTLMNVSINNCSAVGGNGGSYSSSFSTGNEGGGGGGGFSGNGGSITISGSTGGAGGGGFGGNGGNVTLSTSDLSGGGGGGGGGLGSLATIGTVTNLGNGGSDQNAGLNGSGYGLSITAGSGGGSNNNSGGNNAGGGGGGAGTTSGGGGGGSAGTNGTQPQGSTPPLRGPVPIKGVTHKRAGKSVSEVLHELSVRASKSKGIKIRLNDAKEHQGIIVPLKVHGGSVVPSGGNGGDGAGGGGGGVVLTATTNEIDGQPGSGGYGGGGGGGAGTGAFDVNYTVQGGSGGVGGGGGGGGVNQSGITPAPGGNSLGGGGGGGGGPSNGSTAAGGSDTGSLGGGSGGTGANTVGSGFGGGGGGGGSGLGGAIFVDSDLNFTIQALSGIPTTFNTLNNTTQGGTHGTGGSGGGSDGSDGAALGNSIFLRSGSSLTLMAQNAGDVLTLGNQVSFTDDTNLGAGGTVVFVKGEGTVIYNGTTDYQGAITINDANFKVNGLIDEASIFVCRDNVSSQRGILSGIGTLTGSVFVNSGTISPDTAGTLTLGSLNLNSAGGSSLGSLVYININSGGTSLVAVTGSATLAGILEINLDSNTAPGNYTLLTSSGITGTFDSVTFAGGKTPNYTLSYLPAGAPTHVVLDFLGFPSSSSVNIPASVNGSPILNPAVVCCGRPILLGPLPVPGSGPTVYTVTNHTGSVTCQIGTTKTQTYLKMQGNNGSCTIVGTKDGVVSNPLTVTAS
jgi:hypothetical protein